MDLASFLLDFGVAAGVGGLIGIEREHRGDEKVVVAGVRTFPLVSIAGLLVALLARNAESPVVLASGVLGAFAVAVFIILMRQSIGQTGLTTPVALIVTFLLGVMIGYGFRLEGVLVGVVTTFLLVSKRRLHGFAHVLDDDEILSALQFMTILFILLPLTAALEPGALGLAWVGRGALLDPFTLLLVVVFVSIISFASLIAMRVVGPRRGVAFSGLLGGLVNSEATTAGLAERAKEERTLVHAAVVGSLLATTTMLVRNLAIVIFAERSFALAFALVPFVVPIALVGIAVSMRVRGEPSATPPQVRVKNPFAVLPALRFAVVFAVVAVAAALAQRAFGVWGVYVTALGGFVSAGAVVASMGSLYSTGSVALEVALRTSLLATAASVAGKLVILRAVNVEAFERARVPYAILTVVALLSALASFFVG